MRKALIFALIFLAVVGGLSLRSYILEKKELNDVRRICSFYYAVAVHYEELNGRPPESLSAKIGGTTLADSIVTRCSEAGIPVISMDSMMVYKDVIEIRHAPCITMNLDSSFAVYWKEDFTEHLYAVYSPSGE
ncbi:MAG: hypothetical protein ABIH38_01235 [Patescibacteria group bacterium]